MSSVDLNKLIDEVLDLDAKATPGPWHIGWVKENSEEVDIDAPDLSIVCTVLNRKDQTLIPHYRTAAPILARTLKKAIEMAKLYSILLELAQET